MGKYFLWASSVCCFRYLPFPCLLSSSLCYLLFCLLLLGSLPSNIVSCSLFISILSPRFPVYFFYVVVTAFWWSLQSLFCVASRIVHRLREIGHGDPGSWSGWQGEGGGIRGGEGWTPEMVTESGHEFVRKAGFSTFHVRRGDFHVAQVGWLVGW